MDRAIGVETEYGLLGRSATGRLGSSEAAQLLFAPLEREYRSSNAFLPSGGRLYLDVGAHPEYATPECRTPRGAVVAGRAGDLLVLDLAARAMADAEAAGTPCRLRLFKNNTDSYGNSYGSHENYQVARATDPDALARALTGFLVTRQLLCGNGRLERGSFRISQRADHLREEFSATTTRARPLVNSRDEPLADPARFRRLHVLAGDSNLSDPSAWLRLATTELVVRLVEDGDHLRRLRLADPVAAVPLVARNPLAVLELASGATITAVGLQREYADAVSAAQPDQEAVLGEWHKVLDALAADDPDAIADTVEWAAKRRLLADYRDRHGLPPDHPRLAAVDLAFHELGPAGLFARLEDRGVVRRCTTPAEIAAALTSPPEPTRAVARSRLVTAARAAGVPYSVDWLRFTVPGPPEDPAGDLSVTLSDPLAAASAEVDALVAELAGSRFAPY